MRHHSKVGEGPRMPSLVRVSIALGRDTKVLENRLDDVCVELGLTLLSQLPFTELQVATSLGLTQTIPPHVRVVTLGLE